jgi:hypothetical protein
MPATQIQVGPPSNVSATDGQIYTQLGGKATEGIVTELHGKYYTQNYRGNCFMVSTVGAGLAIPIITTTSPTLCLWNPLGSGKNAVLLRIALANTNNATTAAGAIFLMADYNAGSSIATGSCFTAFSQAVLGTNLHNCNLGGGNISVMKSAATATVTLTAASTMVVATLGSSGVGTVAGMVASNSVPAIVYDFDGSLIVPPGVAVHLAAGAATTALFTQTLMWEEVPV